jgi:hypothetical protein
VAHAKGRRRTRACADQDPALARRRVGAKADAGAGAGAGVGARTGAGAGTGKGAGAGTVAGSCGMCAGVCASMDTQACKGMWMCCVHVHVRGEGTSLPRTSS